MTTIIVQPSRRWLDVRLRELWAYRELLYFLVWRDVKVRYKQTVLGAAWAVLQPVALMVVFGIFLGHLAKVPSDGVPYPIFTYSALIPWTLFAQALAGASESLVVSQNLLSKVYFPRLLIPIATAASFLVDFVIAFVLLIGMTVHYHVAISLKVAWIPALTFFAFFLAVAVGIWLAALNVRYRDVKYAVPLLIQLWLFASPVAYPSTLVPHRWRVVYGLNPMAGVVEGFRWALLGTHTRPGGLVAVSAAVTVSIFAAGVIYFRRVERTFADVI